MRVTIQYVCVLLMIVCRKQRQARHHHIGPCPVYVSVNLVDVHSLPTLVAGECNWFWYTIATYYITRGWNRILMLTLCLYCLYYHCYSCVILPHVSPNTSSKIVWYFCNMTIKTQNIGVHKWAVMCGDTIQLWYYTEVRAKPQCKNI